MVIADSFQVQSDHFEEYFAPELDKHGYQALYKRKTSEVDCELLSPPIWPVKHFTLFKALVTASRFIVETPNQLMAVQLSFVETGSHMSKNMRFPIALSLPLILSYITPLQGKKLEVHSIY